MTAIRMVVAAIALCGGCLLLKILDSHQTRDLIGTAVACTSSFAFSDVHGEVLEYGLQDVRGLACDDSGQNVFISEGKRSLLVYSTQSGSIVKSKRLICQGAACEVTDRRGLAFVQSALYVAEHGRSQIMVRSFGSLPDKPSSTADVDTLLGTSKPLPGTPESLSAPSGVAVAEHMLFITNDPARDGSAQSSGGLYTCSYTDCRPEAISAHLQHPSGVAAAGKDGPVYVAEVGSHEVDWPIFRKTSDRGWIRSGALGSAAFPGIPSTPFLGIALDDSRSTIFAAGPGGLYIFGRSGRNSGRIIFDDPITGVTSCGKDVYFAAGHMLCRLKMTR